MENHQPIAGGQIPGTLGRCISLSSSRGFISLFVQVLCFLKVIMRRASYLGPTTLRAGSSRQMK